MTTLVSNLNIDHDRVLSFHLLKKAKKTLLILSKYYMYHHNLEPIDFTRYMDIFTFIASLIYSIDEDNEESDHCIKKLKYDFSAIDTISNDEFFDNINRNEALSTLYHFFKRDNFYDDYTHQQFYNGLLYFKMEQYFCDVLAQPNNNNCQLNKYLIDKCNAIRSFDLRLSNLVLYKLTQQQYDHDIIKLFFYIEIYGEIYGDLFDYEKDVLTNTYNIYRMYVNLYGNKSELHFTTYIREIEEQLSKQFNYLSIKYPEFMKRLREIIDEVIIKEITPTEVYITQNWNIPKPILDEHVWRKTSSNKLLAT